MFATAHIRHDLHFEVVAVADWPPVDGPSAAHTVLKRSEARRSDGRLGLLGLGPQPERPPVVGRLVGTPPPVYRPALYTRALGRF